MKKLLGIVVLSLFFNSNVYSEIVKIDCTLNFPNGKKADSYFEFNSQTNDWWAKFIDNKIIWTSISALGEGKWRPIYHTVDRITGVYIVDFGVELDNRPKETDSRSKIYATYEGFCKASAREKLF